VREFWFASGKEAVKVIARAKLAEVNFRMISSPMLVRDVLFLEFSLHLFLYLSQLNEEENCENVAASPEESIDDEDSSDSGEGGSSSSSDDGSDNTGAMRVLRRLTSRARCLSELCTPLRLPLYICIFA
jgi:hypothetical protein